MYFNLWSVQLKKKNENLTVVFKDVLFKIHICCSVSEQKVAKAILYGYRNYFEES